MDIIQDSLQGAPCVYPVDITQHSLQEAPCCTNCSGIAASGCLIRSGALQRTIMLPSHQHTPSRPAASICQSSREAKGGVRLLRVTCTELASWLRILVCWVLIFPHRVSEESARMPAPMAMAPKVHQPTVLHIEDAYKQQQQQQLLSSVLNGNGVGSSGYGGAYKPSQFDMEASKPQGGERCRVVWCWVQRWCWGSGFLIMRNGRVSVAPACSGLVLQDVILPCIDCGQICGKLLHCQELVKSTSNSSQLRYGYAAAAGAFDSQQWWKDHQQVQQETKIAQTN
jgi:hypothetical protein